MTQRTGKDYNSDEIRYLIQKVATEDKENLPAVEKVLTELRNNGGNVMVDKDSVTKNVDVLWIQTENMRKNVLGHKKKDLSCIFLSFTAM